LTRCLLRLVVFLRKFAAWLNKRQELWGLLWYILSLLFLQLSSLLLLDLFHGLKEELLNVAPLIQNHLCDSFQVCTLHALHPNRLCQVLQLLVLFTNDLLVLELEKFSLLFEVGHDLG
jgi:hypothetical protein